MLDKTEMVAVLAGGMLGTVSRWVFCSWISAQSWVMQNGVALPLGTGLVNLLGCFLLGCMAAWAEAGQLQSTAGDGATPEMTGPSLVLWLGVSVGFLGAFTTFSTWALETVELIKRGCLDIAFINVGSSVILGLVAVWGGMMLTRQFLHLG
ncbi:MAG: CrcB family protein [Cyanobacteria bacterium]|nr:CrcB family protein [Cyanobacteriota bacterium]